MTTSALRLALPLVLAAALGAPGAPSALATEKLRVSIPGWQAGLGPYLVATDKGYYAEEGLEPDFVEASGGVAIPALISGTMDISLSGATALSAVLRGAALKVIYVVADRTPYQLWATRPEIKTLHDLKGDLVGIASRGDTYELALRIALRQAGMAPDDLGYTALGFGSAQQAVIQSGSLPAVVITSYDVALMRSEGLLGKSHMVQDLTATVRMPYSGVAASDQFLKSKPDVVKGFLLATLKGQRYMVAFKDQSIEILKHYSKNPDKSTVAIDYATTVPTFTQDGTVPADEARADLEVRADIIKADKSQIGSLDRFYDFAPLRATIAKLDASGWKPKP